MRQLNDTEKQLARYYQSDVDLVCDVLRREFDKNDGNNEWGAYCITTYTGKVEVRSIFSYEEVRGDIGALLMSFFHLIKILEDSGYIFLHDPYSIKATCKKLGEPDGKTTNPVIIPREIATELAHTWPKQITTTEEFEQYVENNFRTREDIRHENQTCATWTAIVVSVLVGLAGIWLSWLSFSKEPNYDKVIQPIIDRQAQQTKILESVDTNLDDISRQVSTSQTDSITLPVLKKQLPTN